MVKEQIKKHIGNFHLYVLTGLILVFFGVLFLSTAFKDVSMDYIFQEEIITTSVEDMQLGTIKLTNNGPITAKVDLKQLVACDNTQNIDLRYVSSNIDRYGYSNSVSLELGSKKSDEIKIMGSRYGYYDEKNENVTNLDLYIYELEKDQYTYGHCKSAEKTDAFANIKVSINYD